MKTQVWALFIVLFFFKFHFIFAGILSNSFSGESLDLSGNGDYYESSPVPLMNNYCIPYPNPDSRNTGDYVSSFLTSGGITNINNANSGFSNGGYGDFSSSHWASQLSGESLSFTVVPGHLVGLWLRIWVDWNQNFLFDANEMVYASPNRKEGNHTGSISIPENIASGNYRMRIMVAYDIIPNNPCGNSFYGEAEDYTIQVICETPADLGVSGVTTGSATISWSGPGSLYRIEWGEAGFVQGSGTMVSGLEDTQYELSGIEPGTGYEFYVQTDCGELQSEWAGPFSFTTLYECPSGDFTFNSQQQIDEFGIRYAHCTNITLNSLTVNGYDITNLDGLSNLRSVVENAFIKYNNSLSDIDGLNGLTSVGGDFQLQGNGQLTHLAALSSLTHIGRNLVIYSNAILNNIQGLNNLTSIGGGLNIQSNYQLPNLDGFNSLTTINGDLLILYNQALTNITGLNGLTEIGGELSIQSNAQLTDLDGFSDLTLINGDLLIYYNNALTNITGLNNLTEIGGLSIQSNAQLTDLDGFSDLTLINGDLLIYYNNALTNITGLNNLSEIGGAFNIQYNAQLTHLDGLSSLTNIHGGFSIISNNALTDISGLNNLTEIGGAFNIRYNAQLIHLDGLSGLANINGSLNIRNNNALTRLDGLTSLTSINGELFIYDNSALSDISGIQYLDFSTVNNLTIALNPSLFVCSFPNICYYIQNGMGANIAGNSGDCSYITWLQNACLAECPNQEDNFSFTSQQQIDDFSNYGYCSSITVGNLSIEGNDITNLDALSIITEIQGNLEIKNNSLLTSLSGLSQISSVGGSLNITQNPLLTSLNGLSNLAAIGENLIIQENNALVDLSGLSQIPNLSGSLQIVSNPALTDISQLFNLTSTGGSLHISNNDQLTNLYGLFNLGSVGGDVQISNNATLMDISGLGAIDQETIIGDNGLVITDNPLLFTCNMPNFCMYLINPEETHPRTIYGNAGDCISDTAINNACETSCLDGNFIFNYQWEIDDFGQNLSYCQNVSGYIIIQGSDITNLDGLSHLRSISGFLSIENSSLTDLSGLENLNYIEGGLSLMNNPFLEELEGLNNLEEVGQNIYISNNTVLTSIESLENLSAIGGGLTIYNSPSLAYINGLNNLSAIGGNLVIQYNDILSQINGFNSLITVGGEVSFVSNPQLTALNGLNNLLSIESSLVIYEHDSLSSLNGLSALTYIGGSLGISFNYELANIALDNLEEVNGSMTIKGNPSIANFNGLGNLTRINGSLEIDSNAILNDITGLQGIDPATIFGLYITYNPELSTCNLLNFCSNLSRPDDIYPSYIDGNAGNCVDESAVANACGFSGDCQSFTIWNGEEWSNGLPDDTKKAIIEGELAVMEDLTACEILLNSGILTVNSGVTLTVQGGIVNQQGSGNFIVESDANLIQNEPLANNEGEITVRRNSTPMMRLDYALWSSPVSGQGIQAFSPETLPNRIYTYEGESSYQPVPDLSSHFIAGKGYMFRTPNNWNLITDANGGNPVPYPGEFSGVPFNGDIAVAIHPESFTSIGNPYPSNLKLGNDPAHTGNDTFLNANPEVAAIYFWTNTYEADGNGGYVGNNWAVYTFLGGTSAGMGSQGVTPLPYVAPGQGFIIRSTGTADTIGFNNSMRTSAETVFFKNGAEELSRFWLNLENEESENYNQILVGYMAHATQGADHQIDGKMFGYEGSAIYSLIEEEKFIIQGRTLPFEISDIVPLGFKATTAGKFKISLENYEGLFATGEINIYLKDKYLNITHNLMVSAYDFESNAGEFKERFEVVYESGETMDVENLDDNLVQVYHNDNQIIVKSETEKILSVELFDLSGKNLHKNEKVNANIYQIPSASLATQLLVVKVLTEKGEVITKKIINK